MFYYILLSSPCLVPVASTAIALKPGDRVIPAAYTRLTCYTRDKVEVLWSDNYYIGTHTFQTWIQ